MSGFIQKTHAQESHRLGKTQENDFKSEMAFGEQ